MTNNNFNKKFIIAIEIIIRIRIFMILNFLGF